MLVQTVKSVFTWQLICLLCLFSAFQLPANAQPSTFKHTATTSNTTNNFTLINHARTNGQANKIIFVSHDYGSGPYVKSPLGVWFTNGKWSIFQQNRKPLPKNARFNVLVQTTADRGVFIHTASSNNIGGHITTIDHPDTNGKPNAKLMVTQHWGASRTYNNHPIGVYYSGGKWRIFNQDYGKMPKGAMFNILVNHPKSFQHTASSSTMKMAHVTKLNHANTNNTSNAFVFITQRWTSVYNPHPVGVWYSGGKWTVYNEDRVAMPTNSKFNVIAFSLNSTNPSNSKDLTGVFKCSDGGYYYIRQIGNKVYWFGEHPNGNFANVMSGNLSRNTISSKWWDVPKGKTRNKGVLQLKVSTDKNTLTYVSATGGFSGRKWTRTSLPTNLPNKRAAQYNGIGYNNLSGAWSCNDKGTYYVNDKDGEVVWVGEAAFSKGQQPKWVNIFIGNCNSTTVKGIWVDVPKGRTKNHGSMTMKMENSGNTLRRTAVTGGFSGSLWNRK